MSLATPIPSQDLNPAHPLSDEQIRYYRDLRTAAQANIKMCNAVALAHGLCPTTFTRQPPQISGPAISRAVQVGNSVHLGMVTGTFWDPGTSGDGAHMTAADMEIRRRQMGAAIADTRRMLDAQTVEPPSLSWSNNPFVDGMIRGDALSANTIRWPQARVVTRDDLGMMTTHDLPRTAREYRMSRENEIFRQDMGVPNGWTFDVDPGLNLEMVVDQCVEVWRRHEPTLRKPIMYVTSFVQERMQRAPHGMYTTRSNGRGELPPGVIGRWKGIDVMPLITRNESFDPGYGRVEIR